MLFDNALNPVDMSLAECLDCYREWTALHYLDCDTLTCPYCDSANTLRFGPKPEAQCNTDIIASAFSL